mgnify:CR=1 FL=1
MAIIQMSHFAPMGHLDAGKLFEPEFQGNKNFQEYVEGSQTRSSQKMMPTVVTLSTTICRKKRARNWVIKEHSLFFGLRYVECQLQS